MRKNFGAKPWTYPQPVFVIGTYDRDGKPNAMSAAWGGIGYDDKIVLCVSFQHQSVKNLLTTQGFTVSMGTLDQLKSCDYVGIVSSAKEPNKFEKAGFTATKSQFVDAPIINELPMCLECKIISYNNETSMLIGQILNVSADESILDEKGRISPELLKPLCFDPVHNDYLLVGERVGNAFRDGLDLAK